MFGDTKVTISSSGDEPINTMIFVYRLFSKEQKQEDRSCTQFITDHIKILAVSELIYILFE